MIGTCTCILQAQRHYSIVIAFQQWPILQAYWAKKDNMMVGFDLAVSGEGDSERRLVRDTLPFQV